jgi:hypothetical protein
MTTLQKPTVKPASFEFIENVLRRGTDFFHTSIVSEALDIKLSKVPSPVIAEEELSGIKSRSEQLIWYPAVDINGKPITAECIVTNLKNEAPMGGKILNSFDQPDCWYRKDGGEPFFNKETARTDKSNLGSWRIVGTTPVPGTCGENFLRQTIIASEYVSNTIYGGNPPEHLKPILNEPAEREQEIAKLMNSNWQEAAELLANMPFSQQFRETLVEALIRVVLNQKVNRVRFLEKEYSWTNGRSRFGELVDVGLADSDGAYVDGWYPRNSNGRVGFFLSRSENVESES